MENDDVPDHIWDDLENNWIVAIDEGSGETFPITTCNSDGLAKHPQEEFRMNINVTGDLNKNSKILHINFKNETNGSTPKLTPTLSSSSPAPSSPSPAPSSPPPPQPQPNNSEPSTIIYDISSSDSEDDRGELEIDDKNDNEIVNDVELTTNESQAQSFLYGFKVYRHEPKLKSHNLSEKARRKDLADSFLKLRELCPNISNRNRPVSKILILKEAKLFIDHLKRKELENSIVHENLLIRSEDLKMKLKTLRIRISATTY